MLQILEQCNRLLAARAASGNRLRRRSAEAHRAAYDHRHAPWIAV